MTDYDILAPVYDDFTDGFDYAKYLDRIFEKAPYLPSSGLALDCGCGTGSLMAELSARGYSCTGVDISPEMLDIASDKLTGLGIEPHLVCQPLEKIDMYGAYDICFCSLDTVNHLSRKQLASFISRMINFTEPGGYFIFDVKTESLMKKNAGLRVADREGSTLILESVFSGKKLTNYITVFTFEDGSYRRSDCIIRETMYGREELAGLLEKSGFKPLGTIRFAGRDILISQKPGSEYDIQKS